ncbi:hypothetical protein KJS94_14440 [Flavihumibacter rivuli]|uniref:hypothetical protein n=1 Tax=Flavihumibacter rivuli TaxID=2838156 RepID=UPI001BDED3D4|nr:hypothetical protein [Flavihumibacter rivuli]ULQ55845.1 hypothetical protein KJS94_14440 [Flavihumibacter rivuli]
MAATIMNHIFLKISFCLFLFSCETSNKKNVRKNYGEFPDPKSSVLIYFSDSNQVELTKCEAVKKSDSLFLKVTDSSSNYQLNILKVKENLSVQFEQLFSITDSSYKKPIFTAIEPSIKLDKASYDKGDNLKGFMKVKISVLHRWTETYSDTISIAGHVYAAAQ